MNFTNVKQLNNWDCVPCFYIDVFTSFNQIKPRCNIEIMTNYDFLCQIIWCNKIFQDRNKCLLYKTWTKSNIVFVKDIFNNDGTFISEDLLLSKLDCNS